MSRNLENTATKVDCIPAQDITEAEIHQFDLYKKRDKIYTRKIKGFYRTLRTYSVFPLLLAYFGLPWISWEQRPAILFDLAARKFHIFGMTFWPQDFYLLGLLLMISAFTLFVFSVWAGRVWCGFTCPQTVWTTLFMWAEQITEGNRNQRIKLDKSKNNLEKTLTKAAKHLIWLSISLATALTFVSYFVPAKVLISQLGSFSAGYWTLLWIGFFTLATYMNAGWLREQVCLYMCPYARFQATMFDRDTLIVSYNRKRGEPRGARKRGRNTTGTLGDCVNCELCVQVCPVGIDIRDGLQYECISCGLCVDACNSIMDKMNYQRGLINYTSENQLAGKKSGALRPRLLGYLAALGVIIALFTFQMTSRITVEINAIKDRSTLYNVTSEGLIENSYQLRVINKDPKPHPFMIQVKGNDNLRIVGDPELNLDAGEVQTLTLRLQLDPAFMDLPNSNITFSVTALDDSSISNTTQSRFIGPGLTQAL